MSLNKKLEDFYDEDPLTFNQGFAEFCEAHQKQFQDWLKTNTDIDAKRAGYLFAANYVSLHLDNVMQTAIKAEKEHRLQQEEAKGYLEKLFEM